jgi:hypothetical protein
MATARPPLGDPLGEGGDALGALLAGFFLAGGHVCLLGGLIAVDSFLGQGTDSVKHLFQKKNG